ncbi:hypothetical protein L208DRAFT_1152642, partial [Tricholoma matsutake]
RIGHLKKGWTDGEIGIEWIKDFDQQTRWKAKGQAWVLLLDGHNSHYTRGFLEFARAVWIHILCYAAHGTHVYQGLDVVIFATLKLYWTQEKDRWEREKWEKISKTNFLAIYGAVHKWALTPANVKMAFEKTGVWLFNHDVVAPAMMAPSLETSCRGHLPVPPGTPV